MRRVPPGVNEFKVERALCSREANHSFAIILAPRNTTMKKMRQKAILDLVRNREISSQEELLEKLLAQKIDVSQSTLSRDIQELRLAKSGGVYTVMEGEAAPASDDSARWIMR